MTPRKRSALTCSFWLCSPQLACCSRPWASTECLLTRSHGARAKSASVWVLTMVMAEGGRLVGIGIALGLIAAFWLTRLIRHQLFQVSPTEPCVFIAVVLVLSAIALLACFLPARRATKINPMEALRYE
ncbi:MAG: hypothetical protein DME19_13465 [Verrucomicrobia bacterium]|nr:MAG: hypothetical protein DME19_13465 [Verrucomicrobiota bacterium]